MRYQPTLISLYYQLILADGEISDKEVAMGKKMIRIEGISESEFNSRLTALKSTDAGTLYIESSEALKKLSRPEQVRCIAWLSVIGNADGFMDRAEWQFIYRLFHKDLDLRLEEIMSVQKQLMRLCYAPEPSISLASVRTIAA